MSQQNNSAGSNARLSDSMGTAADATAAAAKAATQAATGNVAGAAITVASNSSLRKFIIGGIFIIFLIITGACMLVGSAITGTVETLSRSWSENWDEAWMEQGISSQGSTLYQYSTGKINATVQAALNTIADLFKTDHTVDGKDATNKDLPGGELTQVLPEDYETMIQALIDQEALAGENGALRKQMDMIKGRVMQRGMQIMEYASLQYNLEAMAITIAANLSAAMEDPILYSGMDTDNSSYKFDDEVFALSDIQCLKILAAYSVQHDCNLATVDMWDLMDYCGWFDDTFTQMDIGPLGEDNIYQTQVDAHFGSSFGTTISAGDNTKDIYQLTAPYVPFWRGTCTPQWYNEEIAQINKHNEHYFQLLQQSEDGTVPDMIPWGVTNADDELDISKFKMLSEQPQYGIIDKLFTTSVSTLEISRTEYHGADEIAKETIASLIETAAKYIEANTILDLWTDTYGAKSKTTSLGNTVSRDEDGNHSFTVRNPKGSYYLYNTKTKKNTSVVSGKTVRFPNLTADTTYELYCTTTTTIKVPVKVIVNKPNTPTENNKLPQHYDDDIQLAVPETTIVYKDKVVTEKEKIESFTTFPKIGGKEAYQLTVNVNISFTARSVDELTMDLLGLWPGSLEKTEKGGDNCEYADNYAGNPLLKKSWTDSYTAPDGTVHTLNFQRQQPYQYEAYKDIVTALGAILNVSVDGFFEPDYGYGDDIVAMAEKEEVYYRTNNLRTGARYWKICGDAVGRRYDPNQAWCACFVNAVAYQCGYIAEDGCWGNFNGGRWAFSCGYLYKYLTENGYADAHIGTSDPYKPVPGDLIFYDGSGATINADPKDDWKHDHVGIVHHVEENGKVITIEGNVVTSRSNGQNVVDYIDFLKSYRIGTVMGYSTDENGITYPVVIAAYVHPHYPSSYLTNALYLSVTGKTKASAGARFLIDQNPDTLLAGVCRFRIGQLPDVVAAMSEQDTGSRKEELLSAINSGDWTSLMNIWNEIQASAAANDFQVAQQTTCARLYIRPLSTEVMSLTGFDWTKTDFREEILWALATTTDRTSALTSVLRILSAGMSNDISDSQLFEHLMADGYLVGIINANRNILWPGEPVSIQDSWISGIQSVMNLLRYKVPTESEP